MFKRLIMSVALVAMSFVVSAAKPQALPMPLGEQLPVEVVLHQQELAVDVHSTAGLGMQFGLVGALISSAVDNANAKKAEARVAPLRDALISYRFNERFEAELRAKLASEGISADPQLMVLSSSRDFIGAQADADVPKYAMVIAPRYAMDFDFGRMYVQASVYIVDRERKSNGKLKTRYRASRVYNFSHRIEGGKADDYPATWQNLPPNAMADMLDRSVRHVTDMIVYDFSAQGRSEWTASVKKTSAKLGNHEYGGLEVRRGDDWIWLRAGAPGRKLQTRTIVKPGFNNGINGFNVVDPIALASAAATNARTAEMPSPAVTGVSTPSETSHAESVVAPAGAEAQPPSPQTPQPEADTP
ncbi:hypothetical protein [Lysobacter brunescens]|uniref:Uncharacterized protein n=1 Tax=Lysobacter brunescens TaxID=262323 RepID=A0ABW2YH35_9GAMM